ncbi:hypothetical protein EVJ58_g10253 [Rhodofomes roseus]|uniref:HAT C-terminal dimerisation domain-containing protein n=1 Tax=Rhodofomes roseus TaxID=34475 RepID=A0A4Y9XQG6_9APHY|nr:hypothetical protein EVJ58_g10253 [Rhodofomes roseus]
MGPRRTFTKDLFQRYLVEFIVAHDQPVNIVEVPEFRRVLLLCKPDLKDDDIPHRTKTTTLIMENFERHMEGLKVQLKGSAGEISFTTDVWDTKGRRSYMGVTAHWISADIVMQSAVIGFARVYGRHQGTNLAVVLTGVVDRAGIMGNVGKFTMDSASNNATMLSAFEDKLVVKVPDTSFEAVNGNVHCLGHSLNRCSQMFVKKIGALPPDDGRDGDDVEDGDDDGGDPDGPPDDPLSVGIIPKVRRIVRSIRSSPLRRDAWDQTIRTGNTSGVFLPHLREVQLILDVRTRWNSTYDMINPLSDIVRQAYRQFRVRSDEFAAMYPELTESQENDLAAVASLLEVPMKVSLALARDDLPLLADVIPMFETFQSEWEAVLTMDDMSRFHGAIEAALAVATKYYTIMDETDSYVLCMFVHPKYRLDHIKEYWDDFYIQKAQRLIKKKMKVYAAKFGLYSSPGPSSQAPATGKRPIPQGLKGMREISEALQRTAKKNMQPASKSSGIPTTVEEEYSIWAAHGAEPEHGDALAYWRNKTVQTTFPVLFRIAMDYLPIQSTSVPSERAFSSSAETDTPRRNRMGPKLMEATQVSKYLVKRDRLSFTSHMDVSPVE